MIGDRKITRRTALKSMFGTVAMGLAATAVGLPSLTSCSGKKTKRVILYFTGTGNSLYIARQLADENTEFCFACIQNCPQKAIQFAKLEDDPLLSRGELNLEARYRNENVSLAYLRAANSQHR